MGFTAGSGRPTPIEPPKPTPPTPSMSGGKGAGRVSPIVESRPMFRPAPPPVRAGGKGGARVQPTTPPVIRELPKEFKDSVPQPTLGQQLSSPDSRKQLGENLINMGSDTLQQARQQADNFDSASEKQSEFPPEVRPYITDILDKSQAQEEARQQAGTPDFNNIVETSTAVNQGTQQIPPSTGGGGKGSARVAPVTPQPMPMTPPPAPMTPPPIPPGLDNPVFRSLGQQQSAQQPQQSITGMNTNTGSTNSIPAPQSAIFKQGGLIGLMRRR